MLYEFDHQQTRSISTRLGIETSDETLMERIKVRDEDALAALYRRHTPLLRTIISRVVNNDTDTDDLLQEVFVEIWNRVNRYEEAKGKALGWIVTLARRRAIDRVRRRQSYARAEERLRVQTFGEANAMHPSTDDEAMNGDTAEIFRRILATLPVAQREAIQLAYYSGLSQRDIARRTGIPLGTIKTRLELAVRKLRAAISALGGREEWNPARA
jgi:RNA polymerase sigma-70 factor, ECF subfamily